MSLSPMTVSLDDLSALETRYSLVRTHRGPLWDILIVTFLGRCRPEPERRLDDRYMHAMTEAGNEAWEPNGIVLDFSQVQGGPGDRFGWRFTLGKGGPEMPLAVVVGPGSENAFREDLVRSAGNRVFEVGEWVFRDLESALKSVDREVEEEWPGFCGRAAKSRREANRPGGQE